MASLSRRIPWPRLLALRAWTPLADTGLPVMRSLSDRVRKLGPSQYLFVVDSDMQNDATRAPYVTMVVWAQTDGAALRATEMQIEDDIVRTHSEPPPELLPPGVRARYGDIVAYCRATNQDAIETASYRIATDGAFIHKAIRFSSHSYLFRSPTIRDFEKPYAIELELKE